MKKENQDPEPFLIVGCGRTKTRDEVFRESMKDALAQNARKS
jgi:hypothetical protein